jgi:hypothetical protein
LNFSLALAPSQRLRSREAWWRSCCQ